VRHILFAAGWFLLLPLALPLVATGTNPNDTLVIMAWVFGLMGCFAWWAWHDAPAHGASRSVALGFTAAWLPLFVLAVFPYLFFTRGAKAGAIAALKFLCLCIACFIAFVLLFDRVGVLL